MDDEPEIHCQRFGADQAQWSSGPVVAWRKECYILNKMPRFKEGATGAIVIDDRYAPLVISTFIGVVEIAEGQWFEQESARLIQREHARGRRIINIHDTTHIKRTPPEMRKFWAEMSSRNEAIWELGVIETPLVISNALMRGVMTAVGWLNPKVAKLPTYPNIDQAVRGSALKLEAAGMNVSLPFKSYALPAESLHLLERVG